MSSLLAFVLRVFDTDGGGLWHTWFDRELTLAGAVIVREENGSFSKRLVFVRRPLLRIPNLCIHLMSADERAKFGPNKETHLQPIFGAVAEAFGAKAVSGGASAGEAAAANGEAAAAEPLDDRHAPELLRLLSAELNVSASAILDFELTLCDMQPASIWGLNHEFLSSARIDNQIHCFTALRAIVDHAASAPPTQPDVAVIVLFDHEEVGSDSYCGASSTVMADTLQRVSSCLAADEPHAAAEALSITTRKSFFISADVAHAIHPNYPERHQSSHAPKMNGGTVIKTNDNQRYATNSESGFIVREVARMAGAAVQEFMVKNDCPCGSTIGPIISSRTGLRTVDIGVPSLSMHSIRETMGVHDVDNSYQLFRSFFRSFAELDSKCDFCCRPCGKPAKLS